MTKTFLRHTFTENIMAKRKSTRGRVMICKTLHRKLKIERREPHYKSVPNSGASEGWTVPALHVTPVVLLILQTM